MYLTITKIYEEIMDMTTLTASAHSLIDEKQIGQIVTINGIELYYEFYVRPTAKKTILFLHGFLSSSFCYRCLIPKLKDQYQIVNIDLPPFGKSGKSIKYIYSYQNIAATVNELVDQLGLQDVILAGHSMGGQIGLNMIHQRPDRYEKAILFASSGYLQRAKQSLIAMSYLPFFHRFIKNKLIRSGGVETNLEQVVYDHGKITDEMIHGYLQPFVESDEIFKGLKKLLRDREGDLSSEALQEINIPCLLIWGEEDKIVPISVGRRLHKDLPNSKLKILKNTGHLIPEEKPEETCRLMKNFIDNG